MGFSEWDFLAETALQGGKNLSGEAPAKRIFPGQIAVERRGDELQLTNQAG
jgi:hypothetical protein